MTFKDFLPDFTLQSRARKEYWSNLEPSTGRPFSAAKSRPDAWGVTKGSEELVQQKDETTDQQLSKVFDRSVKNGH